MTTTTKALELARVICSAHYRKRARDPRNSYGHEMAHAARIDDGQSDDWDCVQAALAAIIETQEEIAGYLESVAVKRSDKMKIAAIRDGSYREGA